jgi:hypothetical protein
MRRQFRIPRSINILSACLVLPFLFLARAQADTTYVYIKAPAQKVFLPYGLEQSVPLADSGFHRVPGLVMESEFESACRNLGVSNISRAFELITDADTIRYNPSGDPIDVRFMHDWYKIGIPGYVSALDVADFFNDSLGIMAEPPMSVGLNSVETLEPEDRLYQSHQKKYLGDGYIPGKWYRSMGLPSAWAIHNGDASVKIGVFDRGIIGYQADMNDAPFTGDQGVTSVHGTWVAAIIFGDVNDVDGPMAGINWHASRASYLVFDRQNELNASTLVRAWTDGCQFINCCFYLLDDNWNRTYSMLFHEAASAVRMAGGIIIAAAGNAYREGSPTESPADLPEAIAVAAINKYGDRADFSSAGSWVDFAAPGDSVIIAHFPFSLPDSLRDSLIQLPIDIGNGCDPDTQTSMWDSISCGTSFSAPLITGVASLLYSYAQTQGYVLDDVDDIYGILQASADPLNYPPGWNEHTGWGMPMLDDAYSLITKPNSLIRHDVTGSWDESVTGHYSAGVIGPLGLCAAYIVQRHDLQSWYVYPDDYYKVNGVWIRGRSSVGASTNSPIYSTMAGKVLEWNDDSCLVQTSWYEIWNIGGEYEGIWPGSTIDISLKASILGEKRIVAPVASADVSNPVKVTANWTDPNDNEEAQTFYRKVNAGSWTTVELDPDVVSREYADTLASHSYQYKVRPYTAAQQQAYSNAVTFKNPPRTPDNINAVVLSGGSSNKVQVTWQHSSNQLPGTLANYIVRHGRQTCYWAWNPPLWICDTVWTNLNVSLGCTDTTICLNNNTGYAIRVLAKDIYGDVNTVQPNHYIATGADDDCGNPDPECPTLYVQTDQGYEIDNNILSASEDLEQQPGFLHDIYLLQQSPKVDENGYVHVQLREDEHQTTTFDELKLTAAFVDENRAVGISDQGVIFYPVPIKTPVSVHDGSETDVLAELTSKDGESFVSDGPGELLINFGKVGKSGLSASALLENGPGPGFPPPEKNMEKVVPNVDVMGGNILRIDVKDNSGEWVNVGIAPPRKLPSFNYFDLGDRVVPGEDLWMRLRWDHAYDLDHLAFYEFDDAGIERQEFKPAAVTHSSLGDIRDALLAEKDEVTTTLRPGEMISLSFGPIPKAPAGKTTKYVFSCTGRYTIAEYSLTADPILTPDSTGLDQNTPNPFNEATTIFYSLGEDGPVTLEIFNILGQRVTMIVDEFQTAGRHRISWDGRDQRGKHIGSGIYFYRLATGQFSQSKKMILMK